jgi:mRNA interferase MazF
MIGVYLYDIFGASAGNKSSHPSKKGARNKPVIKSLCYRIAPSDSIFYIQGCMRPVVVVSNNMANKHSTIITVVPLSTKIFKKRNLPTHVFVSAYKSEGLEQHSIALCEQVTALDYGRIIENMGKVDRDTLARITEAVQVQVGVFDKYN